MMPVKYRVWDKENKKYMDEMHYKELIFVAMTGKIYFCNFGEWPRDVSDKYEAHLTEGQE